MRNLIIIQHLDREGPGIFMDIAREKNLNVIIKNKLEKLSLRDAVDEIITETKLPRRMIYNEAIKIRDCMFTKN